MKSFVVVTGASTGLGQTICEHLADQGLSVIAAMRNPKKCHWLETSSNVHPLTLDVTKQVDIEQLASRVDTIIGKQGQLTAVINNAGVCLSSPLETVSMAEFNYQLQVNLVGVLSVTQTLMPKLLSAKGSIINIGSGVGRVAPPFLGPYAASKAALEAMTDSLRRELMDTGVRTTLIVPGAILTPVWGKLSDTTDQVIQTMTIEQKERYEKSFTKFSNDNAIAASTSKTKPIDVAICVANILNSKKVKPSYTVGKDAVAGSILSRILPTGLIDTIFRKMITS